MDIPAAPRPGRRSALGLAGLVVAFLFLAPPLFLLAPLALLLLFARPGTIREWLWILLAGAGSVKVLVDAGGEGLPARMLAAGGLIAAASFVLLAHAFPRIRLASRATAAVGAAVAGLVVWSWWSGIGWTAFEAEVAADMRRMLEQLFQESPQEQVDSAVATVPSITGIFPGLAAIQALLGLGLAWAWFHRIAEAPTGSAPGPLVAFRFSDHLIWGAIFTLGLALAPAGPTLSRIAANGAVVWAAWYGLRGLGVVVSFVGGWPLPGRVLLVLLTVLAFPVAASSLLALGIADTWLDFRNRTVPKGNDNADGSNSP